MILISNIGSRDIKYQESFLEKDKIRDLGKELLDKYEKIKRELKFPILNPFFTSEFINKVDKIYLFVSNQEDLRYRSGDTLFFGEIIRKWIEKSLKINVNIVQYTNNPTDYIKLYRFYSDFFTQRESVFNQDNKIIVSLSGGTPQMNNTLYVILSSLYNKTLEFYNIDENQLIPVNHEDTINKLYIKKSGIELTNIYQYQSIIQLLEKYNIKDRNTLIYLLGYAHSRKFFNFDKAREYLQKFLDSIPLSDHLKFQNLQIPNSLNPLFLIKELLFNLELNLKIENYLMFIALLFRIEESLLFQIINYLFKEQDIGDMNDKKDHQKLIKYIESYEIDLLSELKNIKVSGEPLNLERRELSRPILFYIAYNKIKILKKNNIHLYQIDNLLTIFDRINKYCFEFLSKEEKANKYKSNIGSICIGDLRNRSILAHGFEPISKQTIEERYGEEIERFLKDLKEKLVSFLELISNGEINNFENIYNLLNKKMTYYINQL